MPDGIHETKVQQFMSALPLTLAIAGLSHCDPGKYLTEEQMETRARTIKNAYKQSKALLKEISQE